MIILINYPTTVWIEILTYDFGLFPSIITQESVKCESPELEAFDCSFAAVEPPVRLGNVDFRGVTASSEKK